MSGIPEESILEGGSFTPIKLDQFVQDEIDKPSAIVWTVKGNKDLKVSISNRVATIQTPDKYWNGSENITFIATNSKNLSSSETVGFHVESVNNPPEVKKIPNQTIAEKKKFSPIKLDDYVSDPDHEKNQIVWETYVEPTNKKQAEGDLSVEIDKNRIASVLTPDSYWYGEAKITFTATDGEFASDKTTAIFTVTPVNDPPVVKKHPDQVIQEKEYFESIYLDELVTDVDNETSEIKWTVSGGKDLKASIDKHNVATIKAPYEHWNGPAETFTFTATDPEGASASFNTTFTVKSINDPPEFLSHIEDQSIDEKKEFKAIQLDKLVKDIDHSFEQLKWSVSGNKDLKVEFSGKEAKVLIPNPLWNGYETILFKVTDPEGASAESEASFTVHSINDPPVFVKAIPDQSIDEKKTFSTIQLDEFVKDPDHKNQDLSFDVEVKHKGKEPESGTLEVEISEKRVASIKIPNKLWNGSAVATFTVTDPEGATVKQSVNFTVKSINDLPEIKKIPDQNINEKESLASISLEEYLSDPDHEISQLKVELSGLKEIKANLNNATKEVSFQLPYNHWNGTETLTIKVTDPEGGTASTNVKLSVKSINDPPVMKDIANQTIKEKGTFKPIALDQFVSDLDHTNNQLKWTIEGNKDLKAVIDAKKNLMVSTPNPYWNGAETIKLTVTDPEGAKDSRSVTFTVQSVNDKPEFVRAIPNQNIDEKKEFQAIQLDDFIKDPDHKKEELKWTYKAVVASDAPAVRGRKPTPPQDSELKVQIDRNRVATIQIPNKYWNGMADITFTATDPEGASASSTMRANVRSINDLPVISSTAPKGEVIREGGTFKTIDLSTLASDPDHKTSLLKWTITGNKNLKVTLRKDLTAIVAVPHNQWFGTETVIFTVTDPEGGRASHRMEFVVTEVNDPPVISKIPDQKIKEKEKFSPIRLDNFVKDPDDKSSDLIWTVTGAKNLIPKISPNRILTVETPNKYYNGKPEVLNLSVKDKAGAFAVTQVSFEVLSVNDAPMIKNIVSQKIREKQQFKSIQLDNFVEDPDHKKSELKWTAKVEKIVRTPAKKAPVRKTPRKGAKPAPAEPDLVVEIDNNRVAHFKLPSPYFNGERKVTFTVTDPEGAKDSKSAEFIIESVNDLPVWKKIPAQLIKEKEKFTPINLTDFVHDPDHPTHTLKFSVQGAKQLKASINAKKQLLVSTPNLYWNGEEKLNLIVEDPEGGRATQQITFTVTPVNDPPVIKGLVGQKIKEKEKFSILDLTKLATDPDNRPNELSWSVSGNKDLKVDIKAGRAAISTPNKYWYGKETITFTVKDPAGASASAKATFEVTPVNDPPKLQSVSLQTIDEKKSFAPIDFSKLVRDPDNKIEELSWTIDNGLPPGKDKRGRATRAIAPTVKHQLIFNISDKGVLTAKTPNVYWNGSDSVIVNVFDPSGEKASTKVNFIVKSINDAPVVKMIESQEVPQGKLFKPIKLDNYVTDPDHKKHELKWTVTGGRNLMVQVTPGREAIIKAKNPNWSGEETLVFTARDPEGATDKSVTRFIVKHVNAAPIIKNLPNYTIKEDENKGVLAVIRLNQIARDRDHSFNQLKWTFKGNKFLTVKHDPVRNTVTIAQPYEHWNGAAEIITFTVTDPEGASASTKAKFTVIPVNDPPVAKAQVYQTKEGEKLIVDAANGLMSGASDPDNEKPVAVTLVRKPQNGTVNINASNGAFVYIPNKGFYGIDEFTFKLRDKGGLFSKPETAEINVSFKVKDLRNKPAPQKASPAPASGPAKIEPKKAAPKKAAPKKRRKKNN